MKYKVFYVRGLLSVGRLCGYTWMIQGHCSSLLLHWTRKIRISVLFLFSWLHVSGIWRCLWRLSSWILFYTRTFRRFTSIFFNSQFIVEAKKWIFPVVASSRYWIHHLGPDHYGLYDSFPELRIKRLCRPLVALVQISNYISQIPETIWLLTPLY